MNSAADDTLPITSGHTDEANTAADAGHDNSATVVAVGPSQVHVRTAGLGITVIATVAFVVGLSLAQKFLIPLVFSIFLAYTLNPLVHLLERCKIPRFLAVTALITGIMLAFAMNISSLIEEVDAILVKAPDVTHQIAERLLPVRYGKPSLIQKVQTAANEIEKATSQATGNRVDTRKSTGGEEPVLKLKEWLLLGSISLASFFGQAVMVLFLVFFLLLSGDMFKRKLVKMTPTLANKKITVRVLSEINTSIQRYMFMLLVTNLMVGLLSWAAFKALGLENAGAWGVMSGLLHIVPYFGPVLTAMVTGLAAFMQSNSPALALGVAGSSIAVATLVGTFIATWMTGRIAKMNAAAVFISLLFWGWLWGTWGLLLGIPIIVVIKVISEHVDDMGFIAELLGE